MRGLVGTACSRVSTWAELESSKHRSRNKPFIYSFAIDPKNTQDIYAATHFGVFKSVDGGVNWEWDSFHCGPDSSRYLIGRD